MSYQFQRWQRTLGAIMPIVALVSGVALHGCSTTQGARKPPVDWKAAVGGDCTSLVGSYRVQGDADRRNPGEWLALQNMPQEGSLPSLVATGENRVYAAGAQRVTLRRESGGRWQFLSWRGEEIEATAIAVFAPFRCAGGMLTAKSGGYEQGSEMTVWGFAAREVNLYAASNRDLVVENTVVLRQVELLVLVPIVERERYRFYWRFERVGE